MKRPGPVPAVGSPGPAPAVSSGPVPENIRATKVGLWYILFTFLVALAATNTGNNALYLVWSVMLGLLIVSGVVSRQNVRALAVELESPPELYANRPFAVRFRITNQGRLWPRWFLLVHLQPTARPWLVPHLACATSGRGDLELNLPRRGRHRFEAVHVSSLFPFGLFRKGTRYPVAVDWVVFPELFEAAANQLPERADLGSQPRRRRGFGHDLHSLRGFRPGDDPRAIHWKQSAKAGELIFMEREAEGQLRLSILFDNGVGELQTAERRERFERLVSEAATAAVDFLARGFEVELVTREERRPFASGARQRWAILEALALVEAAPRRETALASADPLCPELRLALPPAEEAAA